MAAPEEMPTSKPSSRASRRATLSASSLPTVMISSTRSWSSTGGTNPAPMPWIGCGPFWPPERTGDAAGSTATNRADGLRSLMTCATPVMVPPVPTPATTMSTLPSVSRQTSSAVVTRWMAGFAGFSNCWGEVALIGLGQLLSLGDGT